MVNENKSEVQKIPVWKKINLSVREAAEYSGIGINRIEKLLKEPNCEFVLFIGTKKLVKRSAFEKYLEKTLEI